MFWEFGDGDPHWIMLQDTFRCQARTGAWAQIWLSFVVIFLNAAFLIHLPEIFHAAFCMIKGSWVRKLPRHGRLSWPAFSPSCQPHQHVNHIGMSTTSACQPHHHHQVVGSVRGRERVNSASSGTKPCVLWRWPPWSPKEDLCFRGCGLRSARVADKSEQDCSGSPICIWNG